MNDIVAQPDPAVKPPAYLHARWIASVDRLTLTWTLTDQAALDELVARTAARGRP